MDQWVTLKSGVLRKGDLFAKEYPTGWYIVRLIKTGSGPGYGSTENFGDVVGPTKTFEEAVKKL